MNIDDWLIFAQIVKIGGLSAASRQLGMPKSTLSRRLAKLEEDFGARLLIRRGRTFELTDSGRLFYQEARDLSQHVNNAQERLNESSQREDGTVLMTAPKASGGQFLSIWLSAFIQQHPHIRVELDLNDYMLNLVEKGYDLALRVGPMADSALVARKLGQSHRILVASKDYIKQHGKPESPTELNQHRCIGFSEQRSGRELWLLNNDKQSQRINFNPVLRSNDMATTHRTCLSGTGIALIPTFVCRASIESGNLQQVLPQWHGPTAEFYLVYPEKELMPRRVRLLVDFLVDQAQKNNTNL
ncbi:MAG: LysR family transcriptional regulator [Gammaproteobacteria bacterium]|nr:LysR family transcriptional regulator [Gammaproteobacteria bacterium]